MGVSREQLNSWMRRMPSDMAENIRRQLTDRKPPEKRPVPGTMNRWERIHADYLEDLRRRGEIVWWGFEKIKLKLAPKTYYTPDFCVIMNDGKMEFHEVKGFMRDDAAVKIKVAAELIPIPILLIRKVKGEMSIVKYGNCKKE